MEFQKIHNDTIELMNEANKILSEENQLWYNGQFYTGSMSPEILFIGFNPGYGMEGWSKRQQIEHSSDFTLQDVKYIEEYKDKSRLASQIYFLLGACIGRNEEETTEYIHNNVAETNFIHFNTPNIEIYNQSLKELPADFVEKLHLHFSNSILNVFEQTKPKLILVNGKGTFDQLRKKIQLDKIEILEKNSSGHMVCGVSLFNNTYVLVTKHLSSSLSDSQLGSISSYIKSYL